MDSVISTAVSGLNAATTRLNAAAANIANANTPNYKSLNVEQTANQNGGVNAQVVNDNRESDSVSISSTISNTFSGTGPSFTSSNDVSLDDQVVNAKVASYDYKANLRVIKTEDDMQQSLLDVTA